MPCLVLTELVENQLDTAATWDIVSYSVTGYGNSRSTYSAYEPLYVMDPDYEDVEYAIDLINSLRNNEIISVD